MGAGAVGGVAAGGAAALLGAPKPVIGLAAIGGAGAGYYMTNTAVCCRRPCCKAEAKFIKLGIFVTIVIPTDRIFDVNSAELLPQAAPI